MLIEQIIEVESNVPGLLVVRIPKTGYFHDKIKIFKDKSSGECYKKQCTLIPLTKSIKL